MEAPPPMSGCMIWWVSGRVGSGQITKNRINLDLIKIIQSGHFGHFYLNNFSPLQGYFYLCTVIMLEGCDSLLSPCRSLSSGLFLMVLLLLGQTSQNLVKLFIFLTSFCQFEAHSNHCFLPSPRLFLL